MKNLFVPFLFVFHFFSVHGYAQYAHYAQQPDDQCDTCKNAHDKQIQPIADMAPYLPATQFGFFSLGAPEIPAPVQASANSVFKLAVLAGATDEHLMTLDIRGDKAALYKQNITKLGPPQYDDIDKTVMIKQIEYCERSNDEDDKKECIVTQDIRRSTGFLMGDGKTLWTNAHSIDGFLEVVQRLGGQKKLDVLQSGRPLRVFVFNNKGDLVFDPFIEKAIATLVPRASRVAELRNNFYAEDSDYIRIGLTKELGKPLGLAAKPPRLGEALYIPGYPACTGCDTSIFNTEGGRADLLDFSDRSPKPNSDGNNLQFSSGRILDAYSTTRFLGLSGAAGSVFNMSAIVFSTADSNHGNSGGPLLDRDGKVFAIHAGGKSRVVDGKLYRISRGVIPPEFLNQK